MSHDYYRQAEEADLVGCLYGLVALAFLAVITLLGVLYWLLSR